MRGEIDVMKRASRMLKTNKSTTRFVIGKTTELLAACLGIALAAQLLLDGITTLRKK